MIYLYLLQEKHVKEKQIQHWKEIIQLQEKLKTNQNRIITTTDKVEILHKEYKELEAVTNRDVTKEFAFRTKQRDLNAACKEFDRLKEEENTLTKKLQELDARPPSDVYLSSRYCVSSYNSFGIKTLKCFFLACNLKIFFFTLS